MLKSDGEDGAGAGLIATCSRFVTATTGYAGAPAVSMSRHAAGHNGFELDSD